MAQLSYTDLNKAFSECIERIGESLVAFPWENKSAYGQWLAQTYYFVRHTTSFLGLTASRFGHWQRDRQYGQLRHLREESGHDLILLEDLRVLGFKYGDFCELPETSALYQSQYYFIEHEFPAAHFGYALCLEGVAAKKIALFYPRVERSFSSQAAQFLKVHMVEDQGHFERGVETLSELESREIDSAYRNLYQTSAFYIGMLERIKVGVTRSS